MIKLDLAGVAERDVDVRLDGRIVRIAGVRRDRSLPKDCVPYAIEISYSRFERVFELPEAPEQASISIDEGMVLIRLEEVHRD